MKFMLILLTFITCLYTLVTGLMSFYYDMWNRRIIHFWWLKVYAILINLLLLIAAPFFFRCDLLKVDPVGPNDVVYYAMYLNTFIAMSLVTYTIFLRWQRERRVIALTMEFRRLELVYFGKWSRNNDEMCLLNRLLYAKVLVMLYQTLINYADSEDLLYSSSNALESFMCVFYEVSMINITNGVIFQYFMGLWHICARYHTNNMELRDIVDKLSQIGNSAALISKLRNLLDANNELSCLISLLSATFKYECLAMLLIYFTNNVLTGYYAVLFLVGEVEDADVVVALLEISFYIGTVLDMLLLVWICDLILKACEETAIILQQLLALSLTDIRLNRICERYYLRAACNKLRISIFGAFDINRSNGFATISSICLYTIFLVQSDYNYLVEYND